MELSDWEQKLLKAPFYSQDYEASAFIFERDCVRKLAKEKGLDYATAERELASRGHIFSEPLLEILDFSFDKNKDPHSELCRATEIAFAQFGKKPVEKIYFSDAGFTFRDFMDWPKTQFEALAEQFEKRNTVFKVRNSIGLKFGYSVEFLYAVEESCDIPDECVVHCKCGAIDSEQTWRNYVHMLVKPCQ